MKKILMAAVVVLVSGTSLAFAATNGNSISEPGSRHCSLPGHNNYDPNRTRNGRPLALFPSNGHPENANRCRRRDPIHSSSG